MPVRSELIQPLLPSVAPIRLVPREAKLPRASGPPVAALFPATIVLAMFAVGGRRCRRRGGGIAGDSTVRHVERGAIVHEDPSALAAGAVTVERAVGDRQLAYQDGDASAPLRADRVAAEGAAADRAAVDARVIRVRYGAAGGTRRVVREATIVEFDMTLSEVEEHPPEALARFWVNVQSRASRAPRVDAAAAVAVGECHIQFEDAGGDRHRATEFVEEPAAVVWLELLARVLELTVRVPRL